MGLVVLAAAGGALLCGRVLLAIHYVTDRSIIILVQALIARIQRSSVRLRLRLIYEAVLCLDSRHLLLLLGLLLLADRGGGRRRLLLFQYGLRSQVIGQGAGGSNAVLLL